ncbi:MAG: hypothetical protein ACPGO9_05220 [Flavobacteriaceae bacterium]
MKRDFIIENTKLNETEKATFYDLFDEYENRYHNEVWLLKRKVRKEVSNAFDTISSESASKYINEYFQFEQLGMTIKHERNQKLLKLIRPKEVLRILHQEKEFDQVMLNRMRNRPKKEQEKGKEKE